MSHFKNFKTVVYIPAGVAIRRPLEKFKSDYEFLEKYVGLDKVYLETFRGETTEYEKLVELRDFFELKGVEVAGGITTVYGSDDGKQRLFGTLCYSNKEMRDKIRGIAAYTAELFDEIILDDFYFTNCTCEECIKAKGERSWPDFRRDLMKDVSENLIKGPAKKINPGVKVTVKYPNWRESFHDTGYVPEVEPEIFDKIYTGTETRSPRYTDQHLPEYLSYALMRWTDNIRNTENGGGWIDTYQCWSIDRYLEQAYLTLLSRPEEIMFFQWSDLIEHRFTTPLGLILKQYDELLDKLGKPCGIKTYIPFASDGENHIEMRLGMQGIPVEMTPYFPDNGETVLLTESSLKDEDIADKLREHLLKGGNAVVTSGFAGGLDKKAWAELSEVRITGRKINVDRYMDTDDREAGHSEHARPVLFPDIMHGNNASWSLLNGGSDDYMSTLFIKSPYRKGRLYTLAVPENPADLKFMPAAATDRIKFILSDDVYISAVNTSLFCYDNNTFAVYRYVKDEIHPAKATVHIKRKASAIRDLVSGEEIKLQERVFRYDLEKVTEYVCDIFTEPGLIRAFEIID